MEFKSIHQAIKQQAEENPDAIALLAPGKQPLSYSALYLHIETIVKSLNGLGIGQNDRVAIVLPNGAEMAAAFLGVASAAASAPLNPSYRADDFDFYLSDLNARALLIQSGVNSPAREIAFAKGIPVIEISSKPENPAGIFSLDGIEPRSDSPAHFAAPDDVALVLHTSGTTSRPKIVPLTQINICSSAYNIISTLQLTGQDRCLNVMPLFHIHGLMAVVLSSMITGASIVCTPGFQPEKFFEWLSLFQPTWYSAVPTMHQAILDRVDGNFDVIARSSLRFIRSSSASLPPQVMKRLEEVFNTPVIEAYGMTEASHQMASNPLPPLPRKPGTVGTAAGPDVRIMDEQGNFLPAGQPGEIVIKGENVTLGYENNPSANESAFTSGWFRTGDIGLLDADGYLSITGRLKEMVNRGGEKVAPREVDEALLDHPDVAQAVAFGVPHATLGEDLAAAVVLRENSNLTEKELRDFAFSRLVDFKVPSQIVIVDEIPKGPTGKLQRIGLAEKLASNLSADYAPPRNALEESLAGIWAEILDIDQVGIYDNFFCLGGDSLSAVSVMLSVEEVVNKELNPSILFRAPTVEQLAALLQSGLADDSSFLVPLQPNGSKNPLFCIPGHGGDVFTFAELARRLQPDQPVYAFRFPELAVQDNTVADAMREELAVRYVAEMRTLLPDGPYQIAGYCYGGEVAYEMAQQLLAQGQKVDFLALIYTYLKGSIRLPGLRKRIELHIESFRESSLTEKITYLPKRIVKIKNLAIQKLFPGKTRHAEGAAPKAPFMPTYYSGKITLFQPTGGMGNMVYDPMMGWNGLAADIEKFDVPGDKLSIFKDPHVQTLADFFRQCLNNSTSEGQ